MTPPIDRCPFCTETVLALPGAHGELRALVVHLLDGQPAHDEIAPLLEAAEQFLAMIPEIAKSYAVLAERLFGPEIPPAFRRWIAGE